MILKKKLKWRTDFKKNMELLAENPKMTTKTEVWSQVKSGRECITGKKVENIF